MGGVPMTWDEQIALRTLWGEARGEPREGQLAVAHVFLNRVKDGRWGKSLATVCLASMQFSCWNASDPNRALMAALQDDGAELEKLKSVLDEARKGSDPTQGATHYFSTSMIQPPKWSIGATHTGQIGRHRFYRDVK